MRLFFLLSILFTVSVAFAQEGFEETLSSVEPEVVSGGFNERADNSVSVRLGNWMNGWNASAFSFASLMEQDVAERGGARLVTSNYIGFKRYIPNGWRAGFNIAFDYRSVGYDRFNGDNIQKEEFEFTDLQVEFIKNRFARLPFEIEMREAFRIYLPTGEASREKGQIARFRNYAIFTKRWMRRLESVYHNQLNYYHQTRTVYLNEFQGSDGQMVQTASLTKQYEIDQWLETYVLFTETFAAGATVGTEDTWYNSSEIENKKRQYHFMKVGPVIKFAATDSIRFSLSYEDKVDGMTEAENFGKFKPENSQLVLLTFIDL